MEGLIKLYLEKGDPETELEVRFGTKGEKITKINYNNVIKKLKSLGFVLLSENPEERLRITIDGKKIRCDINGIDSISNYCKKDDITKIKANNYTFIEKKYLVTEDGQELKPYDQPMFNFRVSCQSEKLVPVEVTDDIVTKWRDLKKTFRYINRISFVHPTMPYIKIDMTIVKTSLKKGGFYIPEFNIESANVFNNPENYEIEIELLQNDDTLVNVIANTKKVIKYILCGLQETNYPIPLDEKLQTIYNYIALTRGKKHLDEKKFKDEHYNDARQYINSFNFIGPNQVTLQFNNIIKPYQGQIDNINNNYTVTEKADGLRKLLYVDYRGKVYFITTRLDVQFTGMKASDKALFNTLLDGEHILYNKKGEFINLFAVFDMYISNNVDIRQNQLFNPELTSSRYNRLTEYVNSISINFKNIVGNIKNSLKMRPKIFYGNSQNIFVACNQLLTNIEKGLFEYETDGLIFTPANLGVGQEKPGDTIENKKKTWRKCFKWKPPEFNTNDFLVTTLKNSSGKDQINDYIEEGTNASDGEQIVQYKTLTLRCGYSEKYLNPLQNLIDDVLVVKGRQIEYKPVPFYPTEPSDNEAHICKIILKRDNNGTLQMITEEGDVFSDKTIVEFKYVLDNKKHMKWVPLRVRDDKTSKYLANEKEYGNNYETANSNWKMIHNPITDEMLKTGKGIPNNLDTEVYYNRNNEESRTKAMRNFHNLYVKNKLISSVSNPGDTLIDYAVGKAGDLSKWNNAKLSFVYGIDYSDDNIENKKDGACVRYMEFKSKTKSAPDAMFSVGNSVLNYKTGQGLKTDRDRVIYNAIIGRGNKSEKQLGRGVFKNFGKGADGFNISSCQFAIHYFFEDLASIKGFIRNVAENTKLGGYFIGTCYDGNTIFKKMQGLKIGESYSVYKNDNIILELTKQFNNEEFNNDDSSLGIAIDVLQETIGVKWREYLVNMDYLIRLMETFGFKPLEKQEYEEAGLPASIGNFNMLYNKMEDEMSANVKLKYGEASNMSDSEKEISFLNKFFVFKKVRQVDTPRVTLEETDKFVIASEIEAKKSDELSLEEDAEIDNYKLGYDNAYKIYDKLYEKGYRDGEDENPKKPVGLIEPPTNDYDKGYNDGVIEIYDEGYDDAVNA